MRRLAVVVVLLAACEPTPSAQPQPSATTRQSAAATATAPVARAAEAATAEATSTAPSATATAAPAAPASPCPESMVLVDDFCIDRFEAHLRRDSAAGRAHAHHERPAPDVQYVAVSARGVFPQAYISRDEATAACAAAGKRLCTRREWLRACRGTRGVPDPHDGSRVCNHGKPHLLTKLFGDGRDYEEHYNSPQLNQTPGFLAETGSHEACRSTAGVYDMVGNLHEWVSDAVTSEFLRDFERESVRREFQYVQLGSAIFMGGFYSTRAELGEGCAFTTIAHDRRYHDYSTGFRCCRDETDDQSG